MQRPIANAVAVMTGVQAVARKVAMPSVWRESGATILHIVGLLRLDDFTEISLTRIAGGLRVVHVEPELLNGAWDYARLITDGSRRGVTLHSGEGYGNRVMRSASGAMRLNRSVLELSRPYPPSRPLHTANGGGNTFNGCHHAAFKVECCGNPVGKKWSSHQ